MKKDIGYVYLLISRSRIVDGKYPAKFGCTRSSFKKRQSHAERIYGFSFDTIILIPVNKPYTVESEIKFKWGDSNYCQIFMGSEFIGIEPDDIDYSISEFKAIAHGL